LALQAVLELPSSSHVPVMQAVFGLVPPAQWVPDSQLAHTVGEVGVPAVVCSVPAAQFPTGWHTLWFVPLV